MKYLQIKEQLLNEINMSPNALRRAAKEIGAKAGMEFEMIVPGAAESDEGDDYQEPDYDSDESISRIQDAFDFFYDGDFNSRGDCQRLVDKMREDYTEWLGEHLGDRWETDKLEAIYDWLRYNAAPSQVFEILGQEEDENGNFPDPTKEDYRNASAKVAEDQISPWYEEAEEDFNDNFYGNEDLEEEWLESVDINTMQDVESNYNITWPHYYNPDTSGGDVSIEDAADSFSRAIGREVQASNNYHSRSITRPSATELHYVVEPDGSLEADEPEDGGLEFVSPALPIDELLSDLKKVKAWADKTGCYTNDSTGLHINVSVPKWQGDLQNLDYVKLAILMGDEYVLENFGRSGNTYAKSALKIVRDNITQRPEDVKRLLDTMKEHLNTSAAKLIHSGSTSKYTSVNTKDGYIEFRSPGGDWLNENFDKIESTLLRFVVAMDAAVDETKYKEEYAKKLYKLLAGNDKDATNTMVYFAKYAAGELPQSALKSFIKQAQFERSQGKEPNGKKMWYRVDKEGRGASNGASIEVLATSKEEALEKAASEWMVRLNSLTAADAYPVRAYEEPKLAPYDPNGKYIISKFRADGPNTVAYRFSADTWNKADWVLTAWLTANNITDRDDVRKYSIRFDPEKNEGQAAGSPAPAATGSGPKYEIFNLNTNRSVEDAPASIANDAQALEHLQDYIAQGPHGLQSGQARNMFGIRRRGDSEPILARPFSQGQSSRFEIYRISDGRTVEYNGQPLQVNATSIDDADERARQVIAAANLGAPQLFGVRSVLQPPAQNNAPDVNLDTEISSPTGQWKIIDGLGREVYRFRPAQNTETKAKELASAWAQDGQFDGNYRVLPVGHNDSTPRPIPGVTDIEPDISGPDIRPASPRTDRPFVWKVIGSSQSPYQSQGTEVVARSEFEAMQKARQQWNLNTSGASEEQFFSTNGWSATPVRPAPVQGSTQDLQQQRAQGGFTGAWKIVDADDRELYRFSGIGNNQADANRVAALWMRDNGHDNTEGLHVLPVMR